MRAKRGNLIKKRKTITRLEVRVEGETVWLTQESLAKLFGVNQPAISKHIGNIYSSGELERDGTYSNLEYMIKADCQDDLLSRLI